MNYIFLQESQLSTELMVDGGGIFYSYRGGKKTLTQSTYPWNQKLLGVYPDNTFSIGISQGIKSPEHFRVITITIKSILPGKGEREVTNIFKLLPSRDGVYFFNPLNLGLVWLVLANRTLGKHDISRGLKDLVHWALPFPPPCKQAWTSRAFTAASWDVSELVQARRTT